MELGPHAVADGVPRRLRSGRIFDGEGVLVGDAMVETWQADPQGRFPDLWDHGGPSGLEGFRGFGRCGYEAGDGTYEIFTVKPGPVPGPGGVQQAPHIAMSVFARGLLNRLVTRVYFADEADANAADPVLASVPADRRATPLAQPTDDGYRLEIHLQGPGETVFFAV